MKRPDWVSKSDVAAFYRCPYAYWLVYSGQVAPDQAVSEVQAMQFERGIAFQEQVESAALPESAEAEAEQDAEHLPEAGIVLRPPMFHNRRRHLRGRPDGIDLTAGAWLPVEIKSHAKVQPLDELELAFYWLLLEPHRTQRRARPRGHLVLKQGRMEHWVTVRLTPSRLRWAEYLIREVRRARRDGVEPEVCRCHVCSSLDRERVLTSVRTRRSLTLIHGIARRRAAELKRVGVQTWTDLLACDAAEVAAALEGSSISESMVDGWRHHAESYDRQAPVWFGTGAPLPKSFFALDLEYVPGGHIWLIGLCAVSGRKRRYHALWADSRAALKRNVAALRALLAEAQSPIITWAGTSADLPQLRPYHPGVHATLEGRHLDLYRYVLANVRFPIYNFALKDIGAYLDVARQHAVRDGRESLLLYEQYRRLRGPTKLTLKKQLVSYNRDDLRTLVEITSRLGELRREWSPRRPSEPRRTAMPSRLQRIAMPSADLRSVLLNQV